MGTFDGLVTFVVLQMVTVVTTHRYVPLLLLLPSAYREGCPERWTPYCFGTTGHRI